MLSTFFFFYGIGTLIGLVYVFFRYGIPTVIMILKLFWDVLVTWKNAFMEGVTEELARERGNG